MKKLLKEEYLLEKLTEYLMECDSDEFQRICGEVFGGDLVLISENPTDGETYEFEPNLYYWGAFGNKEDFQQNEEK